MTYRVHLVHKDNGSYVLHSGPIQGPVPREGEEVHMVVSEVAIDFVAEKVRHFITHDGLTSSAAVGGVVNDFCFGKIRESAQWTFVEL